VEVEELGAEGENLPQFFPTPPSWHPLDVGACPFLCFLFCLSFVISLVSVVSSWDRPGRRTKVSLQRAGQEADFASAIYAAYE